MMRKSKKITSMPVISLEEGQKIGVVKELVVDPARKKIAAMIIDQKGWFKEQRIIPFHKIHSVGEDAITIEKSSGVEKAGSLPEIVRLLKDRVMVTGSKIVSENGTVLGFVDEYYIDLSTGTIAGLEFSGNVIDSMVKGRAFLDIFYVRTLGKEVVVITNEGLENVYKLDGGLQETVKNLKDSTGQIWETTVQKTRVISSNINKSLEKVKKDRKPEDEFPAPDEEEKKLKAVTEEVPQAPPPGVESSTGLEKDAAPDSAGTPDRTGDPPAESSAGNGKNAPPPA